MNTKIPLFYILVFFLLPTDGFPVYDFLSINMTPTETDIQFCFHPNYLLKKAHTYLAAEVDSELYFISQDKALHHWLPDNEPPIFAEKASVFDPPPPICFEPIPKTGMQGISVYAGVGTSLTDVVENNRYAKIFSGFVELPQATRKWTVMVYMVGSDLEDVDKEKARYASKDILEMLTGTSQSETEAASLVISTGGSKRYGWNTVKRTFIQEGQQYVLEDVGAKSMAEPQTLSDFVVWSKANFPAQHYALILWDHGVGAMGFGKDTSEADNIKLMNLPELHQAYQDIRNRIGEPLDIVVYDACLMASIEVAEVTATVTNAMAGSAELEPGHGIDYAHLMSHIGATPPDDGLAFGSMVKNGYIQHAKAKGTFDKKHITYSVFDLTQLKSFSEIFKKLSIEFNNLLHNLSFMTYQSLSRGLIRAPGYPLKKAGRLRSLDKNHIRIDLYSILQTIGSDFPEFKAYADQLLGIIDQMVVDYDGNIADIDPNAGRVTIDIGNEKSYLVALPEAYTLLSEGFDFYNQKRQNDLFTPDGELGCPQEGILCCFAQWLKLQADDILGIEVYFGQSSAESLNIYRIDKSFYQYRELTEDLELGVDGHKACQYQVCVNESHCEDITLTEQGNQLLAEIQLNESPAVLSFCQAADGMWSACGVVQQTEGIWGRDEVLYPNDSVVPSTLHLQQAELEQRQGNALVVEESALVTLKTNCDPIKGAISAAFYSLNGEHQFERLCDSGDCICQAGDTYPGCQETGFKAGVILKYLPILN